MSTQDTISRRKVLTLLFLGLSTTLLTGCFKTKINIDNPRYAMQPNKSSQSSARRGGVPAASNIVSTAKTQLGVKYKSGGASPAVGFDCSGFIWWTYNQHGIKVPRVTKDQAYAGSPVPLNNIQPGDILVFSQKNSPNNLHTAIYTGNGKFIHSPNSRSVVREESLSIPYWKNTLLIARRVAA